MSVYNRDYMRDGGAPSGILGGPSSWSVVTWLMVLNIAVFVIDLIAQGALYRYGNLSIGSLQQGRVWTPVTYAFLHGGLLHLGGNLLGLFFLGRILQQIMGPRHVLRVYFLGALTGGFLQVLFNFLVGDAPIIGASGAVLAIIFAVATVIPHERFQLLLFFVLPVKMTMRQMALLFLAIDGITLIMVLTGAAAGIAVMAHFGGMFFGWFYSRHWYPRLQNRTTEKERRSRWAEKFGVRVIRDAEVSDEGPTAPASPKEPFVTEDVDAILDKINEHGFQSLTAKEKKILEKSSKKLSNRLDPES